MVRIEYVSATPEPGSTLAGCGPQIAGCSGRIRIRFRLIPALDGPALFTRAWLFSSDRRACLTADGERMALKGGVAADVDMTFDRADDCGVPLDVSHLKFVIEGPVPVSSSREWGIRYAFAR